MSFLMLLRISFRALRRNKVRSFLTMLGIIIGVAAVIAMVSLGQGARNQVQQEMANMGTNTLRVFAGSQRTMGMRSGAGTQTTLTPEDFDAIQAECPAVKNVSPSASTNSLIVFGNQNWTTRVEGYNQDYLQIRSWPMASGSFFDSGHVRSAARVAVLGQTVVDNLFSGADPVGQVIRIKGLPFQVIGVLTSKGQTSFGQDMDDTVMVPYTTVMKKFQRGTLNVNSGIVQAVSEVATYTAEDQITQLLRQRHHISVGQDDDFMVRNLSEVAETAENTSRILTALLSSIAAVSLLVGGIGIMNIMLVAVSERTREIGIRMAIGARPGHVRIQFLSESIILCLMGGLLGLAIGVGISLGISSMLGWPVEISSLSAIISIGFSGSVGIFFGYYPAHKAASLDPIEALRYE